MNGLEARRKIAEFFRDTAWSATLRTYPEYNATLNVQVGHVAPTRRALQRHMYAIPVALVVNEGNADAAVEALYEAVSWQDGSLVLRLEAEPWVDHVTVDTVAPDEVVGAPFVRAELTVTTKDGGD